MKYACIDMEGVLIPEIWPHLAEKTKISELSVTSREIPDYESLVLSRIKILRQNNIKLQDVVNMISELEPIDGAVNFLNRLNKSYKVILVSDAFEQTIAPLWERLGRPELKCHKFQCDDDGYIKTPVYSRKKGKIEIIESLKSKPEVQILSVGDAFNDLEMLRASTTGYLFRPSIETRNSAEDIPVVSKYEDIM